MTPSEEKIYCAVCEKSPPLATYGVDETGRLFLHIKVRKGSEIKADVYVHGGEVRLKCTRCLKFNRITVVRGTPRLNKTQRPQIVEEHDPTESLPWGRDRT